MKCYRPRQYAPSITAKGPASNLRCHAKRLNQQYVVSCNQRNKFYANIIVSLWNALLSNAMDSKNTNKFKVRIDKTNKNAVKLS